jgi:transposase
MFSFLLSLLDSIFKIFFKRRKNVILTMLLLKKENEIYRRQLNLQKKRMIFKKSDKFTLAMLNALSKRAIGHLTIVKPETVLSWQRRFIKNYWTYKHKLPGRKPVSKDIKNLILEIKQDNPLWGCKKISNELKKINIEIHYNTVNKIIRGFRIRGLIQPNGSWKKFLKMHWDSLYAMDFMTVDTLFGKRIYLLLIMELITRKIVRFDMTENPCREFVKQRIELFSEEFEGKKKTLIFDNASQITSIDYSWYDIGGVNFCTAAPNMNAYAERLVGTVRREALDHFLLFSAKQVRKIVSEFVTYYNNQRMHQGVDRIPDAEIVECTGSIKKLPVLSGLHHHYYRSSA